MAGKEPDIGPTAATVAANVTRLRTNHKLTYTELSERLRQRAGWAINPVGVRRLESGERRIGVDDLVALSVAFDVSPATLLMPHELDMNATVSATGTGAQAANRLWHWLCANEPLKGEGYSKNPIEFWLAAWPEWRQHEAGQELQDRKRRHEDELARRRAAREKGQPGHGDG
ncbi:helix-turn-helix domain-containing protein [Mycobacterium kansasii]|uniref:helix-turn-helix domain-containing protein n=1 Tax=Mycobacterium kansasii TaxID=1768 RepID=UPI003A86E9C8